MSLVPSLWGLGGDSHVGVWVTQLSVSPPGLRCAFKGLPALVVGLVRDRLVTCGMWPGCLQTGTDLKSR